MTQPTARVAIEPTDADYDDMDHALGRPMSLLGEPYRNYYCIAASSETAKRFEALNWWDFGRLINEGRDAIYHVNGAGKEALWQWRRARALSRSASQGGER